MPYDIKVYKGDYIEDIIMNNQDGTLKKFKVDLTLENYKKYIHDLRSIGIISIGRENLVDSSVSKYVTKDINDEGIFILYLDEGCDWVKMVNTATPNHDGGFPIYTNSFDMVKQYNNEFESSYQGLTVISYLSKEELEKL